MKNGGLPAHHLWTSSLTQLVSLWRHVLEHPPDRNIKAPLARNLPSRSAWNAFWQESLNSFQQKTAKKTPNNDKEIFTCYHPPLTKSRIDDINNNKHNHFLLTGRA